MKKTACVCLMALLLVFINGCARRGGGIAGRDLPVPAAPEAGAACGDASLAGFVASAPQGSSRIFSDTPFGQNVKVTVGPSYWCGLGVPCRKADASGRRFAVCQIDGVWTVVRGVFDGPGGSH